MFNLKECRSHAPLEDIATLVTLVKFNALHQKFWFLWRHYCLRHTRIIASVVQFQSHRTVFVFFRRVIVCKARESTKNNSCVVQPAHQHQFDRVLATTIHVTTHRFTASHVEQQFSVVIDRKKIAQKVPEAISSIAKSIASANLPRTQTLTHTFAHRKVKATQHCCNIVASIWSFSTVNEAAIKTILVVISGNHRISTDGCNFLVLGTNSVPGVSTLTPHSTRSCGKRITSTRHDDWHPTTTTTTTIKYNNFHRVTWQLTTNRFQPHPSSTIHGRNSTDLQLKSTSRWIRLGTPFSY